MITHRERWIVGTSAAAAIIAISSIFLLMQQERCKPDENGRFNCSIGSLYAQSQATSDWTVNLPVLLPVIDKCMASPTANVTSKPVVITKHGRRAKG